MGKQRRKPPLALRRRPQGSLLRRNAGIQPTAAMAFLTGHDRLARFIALRAVRSTLVGLRAEGNSLLVAPGLAGNSAIPIVSAERVVGLGAALTAKPEVATPGRNDQTHATCRAAVASDMRGPSRALG